MDGEDVKVLSQRIDELERQNAELTEDLHVQAAKRLQLEAELNAKESRFRAYVYAVNNDMNYKGGRN